MAKKFMLGDKLPAFPFLVRGNSGAIWRVTGFTKDTSLKLEGKEDPIPQCDATCVLEGVDAQFGDTTTLYARSLIINYGAMTVNGQSLKSGLFGDAFGEGNITGPDGEDVPSSVKSTDGIHEDAISRKQ